MFLLFLLAISPAVFANSEQCHCSTPNGDLFSGITPPCGQISKTLECKKAEENKVNEGFMNGDFFKNQDTEDGF